MAYAERRERKMGMRYRGFYKDADGSYRSAGTYDTEERALEVALEAERRAAVVTTAAGGLDPGTRATRTIKEYAPLFLRHHRVEGNTKDTYSDTLRLHVIPFLGGPAGRDGSDGGAELLHGAGRRRAVGEHDPAGQGRPGCDVRHGRRGRVLGFQPVPRREDP